MPEIGLLGQFIWAAAIILGLLIVAGAAVAIVGLWKAPQTVSNVAIALIRSEGVTQTVIALVVIAAILALTILEKIPAAAGIGVLSAIIGYAMGDARRQKSSVEPPPPRSN